MDDLWSDDITSIDIKVPVAILREQAFLLGKKTKNIVEAEVKRIDISDEGSGSGQGIDISNEMPLNSVELNEDLTKFRYGFYILAPALGNYRYKLFTIWHDVNLYPVNFTTDEDIKNEIYPDKNTISAKSEEEFLEILKKIFQSKRTKQIIRAIFSQSVTV